MTVTLRNVDYQFLNIIESILPLCKRVEVDTTYDEPAVRRASTKPQFSSCWIWSTGQGLVCWNWETICAELSWFSWDFVAQEAGLASSTTMISSPADSKPCWKATLWRQFNRLLSVAYTGMQTEMVGGMGLVISDYNIAITTYLARNWTVIIIRLIIACVNICGIKGQCLQINCYNTWFLC